MSCIGFLVNPFAGMGGAVGLKGTDGCLQEARARGAIPLSPSRAIRFLKSVTFKDHFFLTAAGIMGQDELNEAGISNIKIVYSPASDETSADDTQKACLAMRESGADIIVFCGGDGTARDIFKSIGVTLPILGIPTGVKVYSGVFSTTPESGAQVISQFETTHFTDAEVMDVDEILYRAGKLATRIFGIAKIPYIPGLCQSCKQFSSGNEEYVQQDIARFICSLMQPDTLYLLGAGSTTQAISEYLKLPSTLLGIDAVSAGKLVALDLNEDGILSLLRRYDKVRIVVSPIGAQGFVLGRGNQQISARVLKKTGINALIVVATPAKLQQTPVLYVDCGDEYLNNQFDDFLLVICGAQMAQRKILKH